MINLPPVTVTNITTVSTQELAVYINSCVLSHKLPNYTANRPLSVQQHLVPLLSLYANSKAYITELYNIVISCLYDQKKYRRTKDERTNDELYTDLEAKQEILYRTLQSLDRMYEAASRLMTGIGEVDPRDSRH